MPAEDSMKFFVRAGRQEQDQEADPASRAAWGRSGRPAAPWRRHRLSAGVWRTGYGSTWGCRLAARRHPHCGRCSLRLPPVARALHAQWRPPGGASDEDLCGARGHPSRWAPEDHGRARRWLRRAFNAAASTGGAVPGRPRLWQPWSWWHLLRAGRGMCRGLLCFFPPAVQSDRSGG